VAAGLAKHRAQSVGKLAPGVVKPGTSMEAVWTHLHRCLERLVQSLRDSPVANENGVTSRLLSVLEREKGYRSYFFRPEDMQDETDGNSRRVDLAAEAREDADGDVLLVGINESSNRRFLAIEAKRLPTTPKAREREYLSGDRGGIARFKRGDHGSALPVVGMIGYLQKRSAAYWKTTVNAWIDDLIKTPLDGIPWDTHDKLTLNGPDDVLVVRLDSSSHRITDGTRIAIRHLWVQLGAAHSTG
jgi:hypothetical protein